MKLQLVGAYILVSTLVAGCGDVAAEGGSSSVEDPGDGSAKYLMVDDPYPSASLGQLKKLSDLVVTGTVTSAESGVTIGSDPSLSYPGYTVEVQRALKGDVSGSIAVALSSADDGQAIVVHGRATPTEDESVWFLRRMGAEFDMPARTC